MEKEEEEEDEEEEEEEVAWMGLGSSWLAIYIRQKKADIGTQNVREDEGKKKKEKKKK